MSNENKIPEYHPEKNQKNNKNKKSRFTWILSVIIVFVGGLVIGSVVPVKGTERIRESVSNSIASDSDEKFKTILEIMSNDWYFAADIEDVEQRLTDQALAGMTTNDEDAHTEYMSAEEITSFTQSINRSFVGIGVQFRSTEDGLNIVTRVIPNSPAEAAGVQAGDIIHAVDDVIVDGYSASEIKELVTGEEGTYVSIDVLRDGKDIVFKIQRAEVSSTAYGEVKDNGIGYLQIEQFGTTTADEVESVLTQFVQQGITGLVIDLRGDGGGYLDALDGVASLFLPEGTVYISRTYSDGSTIESKTSGGMIEGIENIVILVNENTASAAEAFTLCMKEQRDDVTVVGQTTYGKGSVQVTKYFDDGSAIKYTNALWYSPNGLNVNGTGITPDVEVLLHDFLYTSYSGMDEEDSYAVDSVSDYVKEAQIALDYLGYEVDRYDGYFSYATLAALQAYETEHDLTVSDTLTSTVYEAIISSGVYKWTSDEDADTQLAMAMEILNG